MADRPTASTVTDPQLEQLYAELAQLRVFRDIVYLEAEHWDDGSKNVICAAVDEYGTPTELDGAQQPGPADDDLPCRHGCRAAADELAQETQQDGHAGACGPQTAPGDPEPAEPPNGRQAGAQDREPPTVIHRTPGELRTQRARLIASTGLAEDELRARAEDYQLDTERQLIWNTVEGIDYLLDQRP